ncbi:MAG: serine protease [Saprospiraceae bacterium]
MKLRQNVSLLLVFLLIISCSPVKKLQKKPIGLINNVSFFDSSFDNPNASNGFLVTHKNTTYGVTAKHVLMITKTDKMKVVDFEGDLKEWKMHPKNSKSEYVVMDKLLNPNKTDSLTWDYMYTNWDNYDDWIIFSIKENKSKHNPLKFRNTPLEKGESLYAIGWSYGDTTGIQRVYEYAYEKTEGNYHNLIQIKGPTNLGGLSGSPIVDKKGKLVGLVTSGWEDEKTKEVILEATSTKNMLNFFSKLE